ncbi:DUF4923 family protein [uncultured Prevotella sp.]|uniref:DUF4923 family protein n=1 Tax=uncultured Prevotella sp. TaxID=159272 RepID=UPI0027E30549|nr:DUF4923 family protein [uncultured Prevotella sp.]
MTKVRVLLAAAFFCMSATSIQAQSIKDILSGVISNVVGDKATTESSFKGTWKYNAPACEFESDNLLAKAGGTAAAEKIEKRVAPLLKSVGVNGIVYTFDGKGNYTSKIKKRVTEGTYKFDSKAKTITFTPTIGMAYTAHVAVQGSTMTLTFEADKLMTTLKTISNATSKLSTTAALINTLMNSYSGMRVGFELKK